MSPNFALSLSQEGIVLSQRSAAGWTSLGSVDPASESLTSDLAALRRIASALTSGEILCQIIIPDDQIRYIEIETPGMTEQERRRAARAALDGATPYAVEDLVFDIHAVGERTHVAAVARETLDEAEAFAAAQGFVPVLFTAWPAPGRLFEAEPDFGTARAHHRDEPRAWVAPVAADEDAPDALPDAQDSDAEPDVRSVAEGEPGFVSRRRVPTFRTDPVYTIPEPVEPPGFAEPQTPYVAGISRKPVPPQDTTVLPAPAPVVRRTTSEAERLTIYGAQATDRLSGRGGGAGIAIAAAVILLAGLAAFAGGATTSGLSALLSRLTAPEPEAQFAVAPTIPASLPQTATEPETSAAPALADSADADAEARVAALASPDPSLTDEDAAVLDALRAPLPEVLEEEEAAPVVEDPNALYADTGIWVVAPEVPAPPPLVDLEDLYVTSIDPVEQKFDAVALPAVAGDDHDRVFRAPLPPAPAGTRFVLDDRGMVVPTAAGSLTPDGIRVFAGPPPERPPATLVKVEEPGEDLALRLRLAAVRPSARPGDLIESSERAVFSGLTRSELGQIRPQLRPPSAQDDAAEEARATASLVTLDATGAQTLLEQPQETDFDNATARAVLASLRPDARPEDFDRTVAKALESAPAPAARASAAASTASGLETVAAASAASIAPRTVAPKIPSSASVSREATVKNAINLRKVNLIGVYGAPSSRRALVRMSDGQYRKVQVGDRIDGGQVSAIGDSELRYQKSGRAIVLTMPRG